MISWGTCLLGYYCGFITIKNIMTVGRIGVLSYCVGLIMSKQ